jgi:adenylyltransferase/sulfurtransferase
MSLSKEQIARYSRQLRLPEVGVRGQQRLLDAAVLLVGAGGLGCPAALYLAAAGVGRLTLVDDQAVELSNLHRQVLHTSAGVGTLKVESARQALAALNPELTVDTIPERLTSANALRLAREHDLVLDGSDNFPTRYLVNDACVIAGTPLVHGGAVRLEGQVLTILPGRSACLRCVFPEPPPAEAIPGCQEAGVVGSTVGMIGTLMAHEGLKLLAGFGQPLTDRLLVFDGARSRFREVPVRRDPDCAVCGDRPSIRQPVEYQPSAAAPCAGD